MMKKLLSIIFCLVLTSCVTTSSVSENRLSEQDKQLLNQRLDIVVQEMQQGDMDRLLEMMPPKFFAYMAEKSNMDLEGYKDRMKQIANAVLANTEFKNYVYDLKNTDIKTSSVRRYGFVATENTFLQSNKEITVKGHLLLLEDDNKWYLLTWQDTMADKIYEAYPDLQGIKPPKR